MSDLLNLKAQGVKVTAWDKRFEPATAQTDDPSNAVVEPVYESVERVLSWASVAGPKGQAEYVLVTPKPFKAKLLKASKTDAEFQTAAGVRHYAGRDLEAVALLKTTIALKLECVALGTAIRINTFTGGGNPLYHIGTLVKFDGAAEKVWLKSESGKETAYAFDRIVSVTRDDGLTPL